MVHHNKCEDFEKSVVFGESSSQYENSRKKTVKIVLVTNSGLNLKIMWFQQNKSLTGVTSETMKWQDRESKSVGRQGLLAYRWTFKLTKNTTCSRGLSRGAARQMSTSSLWKNCGNRRGDAWTMRRGGSKIHNTK